MTPFGRMVSFATWQKFIRQSIGSDAMKQRVIDHVTVNLMPEKSKGLLDSFALGYTLGQLSRTLSSQEHVDFLATIVLTRDMNNVPIVQVDGKPVA